MCEEMCKDDSVDILRNLKVLTKVSLPSLKFAYEICQKDNLQVSGL